MRLFPYRRALAAACLLAFIRLSAQDRGLLVVKAKDGSSLGGFKASYALVVGESQYSAGWPQLGGVREDARLVAAALERAGFKVTTKQDLPCEELKRAYEDFIGTYGLEEGNRLLFYYAGHGHTLKLAGGRDMGYIVPVDAPNPNADLTGFKRKALPMQMFDTWARQIEARHALFLFDSCFSGSIFNVTRAAPDNVNEKTLKAVRQFITSGSADEQVPDKSVFRGQFIAGIEGEADRNGDGYVTGAELGEFLDEKVVNYTHRSQHPQYGKIQDPVLDKGDFVFAAPAAAKAAQASPNAPPPAATAAQAPAAAPRMSIVRSYGGLVVTVQAAGSLFLDGKAMGELPAGAEARLEDIEAGERALEMRYAGGKAERVKVQVSGGASSRVSFSYKGDSATAKPAPAPAPPAIKPNPYPPKVIEHMGTATGISYPDWVETSLLGAAGLETKPRFAGSYVFSAIGEGPSLEAASSAAGAKAAGEVSARLQLALHDALVGSSDPKIEFALSEVLEKAAGAAYPELKPEDTWWVRIQQFSADGKPDKQVFRFIQLWSVPKAILDRRIEAFFRDASSSLSPAQREELERVRKEAASRF